MVALKKHYVKPIKIYRKQAMFRESEAWLRGFVGGRGCVAPETMIAGAPIAESNFSVRVSTFGGSQASGLPFLKGVADLYRVRLHCGQEVVVTDAHRFLTPYGWLPLKCLKHGDVIAVGGGSSEEWQKETGQDWKPDYFGCSHLSDELPNPQEVVFAEILQRLGSTNSDSSRSLLRDFCRSSIAGFDLVRLFLSEIEQAPAIACELFRTVWENRFGNTLQSADMSIHCCTWQQLATRQIDERSFGHCDRSGLRDLLGLVHRVSEKAFPLRKAISQLAELFAYTSNRNLEKKVRDQLLQADAVSAWNTIESIEWERKGEFWDLHIPTWNHYSAHGIWHHNTGKTFVGALDVANNAKRGEPWLCVAPDNNMAREVVLPVLEDVLSRTGQYIKHVVSPAPKVFFRTKDGGRAEIIIRGAEKPDKLLGRSVAGLWIEEASTVSQEVFEKLIPVCRFRGKMGRVALTFTPRGFSHWTFGAFHQEITWDDAYKLPLGSYKVYRNKPYLFKDDTFLVTASTRDNPFTHEKFYDRIANNYSSVLAAQELEGEFVEIEGEMFKRSDFKIVQSVPRDCQRVRYWDKASTAGDGCYSAGVLLAKDRNGIVYIESVIRGQWSALERNQIIKQTCEADRAKYGGEVITYIEQEGAGSGKDVNEALIRELGEFEVYSDPASVSARVKVGGVLLPGDAKVRRASLFAAQVQAHNVCVLEAPWMHDFLEECCAFPHYAFCDQVDAASAGYLKIAKSVPFDCEPASRMEPGAYENQYGYLTSELSTPSSLPWA